VIAVLLAASTIAGTFPVFQRGPLPCSVGADSVRDRSDCARYVSAGASYRCRRNRN
jgi:hypothetical protein